MSRVRIKGNLLSHSSLLPVHLKKLKNHDSFVMKLSIHCLKQSVKLFELIELNWQLSISYNFLKWSVDCLLIMSLDFRKLMHCQHMLPIRL
jgi:hypothetical protein